MKTLVSLSFALTTALAFYIFDLRSDLAAARSHVETARASERKALAEVTPLQQNIERLTAEQNQLQTEVKNLAQADGLASPAAQKEDQGLLGGLGKVLAMPEMKSTMRRQAIADTRNKLSDLLKSWGLPKSDENLFIEMVADLESVGMEAFLGMLGNHGNAEEAFKKSEAAEEETKARLKSLLGEARYAEWEKAEEAQSVREANASFKEHLKTAGLELPEAQETQLLKLVEEERRTAGLDSGSGGKELANLSQALTEESIAAELKKTEAYQATVLQKAVTFLNPDQVNALQSAFSEEHSNLKMGIDLMKTFLPTANGKQASPSPAQVK